MKLMKKSLMGLFALMFLLGNGATSLKAANVAPGGSFSATLACGYYEGTVRASGSNASIVSVSGSGWCDRGGSVTATATAGSSGTASISFTSLDVINTNTMTEVPAGTYLSGVSVSIVAPSGGGSTGGGSTGGGSTGGSTPTPQPNDDRSTNANLASLSVSEGTLTPAFNADTTEYSVSLSAEVTKIKVDASAADAKATVSGTGEIALKAGENTITVTVKAENESTKAYVIKAKVDEKPLVYTTYNGTKLGVVRNIDGVQAPATFEKGVISLGGKEVPAWSSKTMNKTIVYLIDEKKNEKNFYIYDVKTKKITTVFKPTSILGRNVFVVDIDKKDQKLEGFTYSKITVDKTEMMGWKFNDKQFENYNLIYVMDDKGVMQYYQYEKTQNTLQLYSKAAPVTQATYEQLTKDLDSANTMKLVFMVLAGLFALTTVAAVATTLKMRTKIK